jgi:iron(III) transport system substrate-binding protein
MAQNHLHRVGTTRLSRRGFVRLAGIGGVRMIASAVAWPGAASASEADHQETSDGTPVGSAGKVTIYSGRNEKLIGDLIAQFERATGIDAVVRYGDTAELAATMLEEGRNSPADVYWAQDGGALGALAREGRLTRLPNDILERVESRFRSRDGLWIGTSGRARVAAYNTDQLTEADLPASVLDLTDPKWKGRIGWAPTNGSFQAFVTALRVVRGDDGAREWLEAMKANEPVTFEGNMLIVRAVGAGEIPLGLTNHYYLYEAKKEEGEAFPAANHFFAPGDPGNLVNVAGVGILDTATNAEQALAFIDYLLQEQGQRYFAERTSEYPLIQGVEPSPELRPLSEIQGPDIDLSDLADLKGTLTMLAEVGVL